MKTELELRYVDIGADFVCGQCGHKSFEMFDEEGQEWECESCGKAYQVQVKIEVLEPDPAI